jgi:hypothetical protein
MALGIFLLTAIFFLYFLLVKGILWRIAIGILGVFAFLGMKAFLLANIVSSKSGCLIIAGHTSSWAEVVPMVILILVAWLPKGE